jgi:hypothetical protein
MLRQISVRDVFVATWSVAGWRGWMCDRVLGIIIDTCTP